MLVRWCPCRRLYQPRSCLHCACNQLLNCSLRQRSHQRACPSFLLMLQTHPWRASIRKVSRGGRTTRKVEQLLHSSRWMVTLSSFRSTQSWQKGKYPLHQPQSRPTLHALKRQDPWRLNRHHPSKLRLQKLFFFGPWQTRPSPSPAPRFLSPRQNL